MSFLEPIRRAAIQELGAVNEKTAKYGLTLTDTQIANLVERRFEALDETGRVEFGPGILQALIDAFCDSPYLMQENYEQTLARLQNLFYHFKNESADRIPDDDLIARMRRLFDDVAQGDLDFMTGKLLEELRKKL